MRESHSQQDLSWQGVAGSLLSPHGNQSSPKREPLTPTESSDVQGSGFESSTDGSNSFSPAPSEIRKRMEAEAARRALVLAKATDLLSPSRASSWTGVSNAMSPQGAPSDERPTRPRSKSSVSAVPTWIYTSAKENDSHQHAAFVSAAKQQQKASAVAAGQQQRQKQQAQMTADAAALAQNEASVAEAIVPYAQPSFTLSSDEQGRLSGVGAIIQRQPEWLRVILQGALCLCIKER